MSDTNSNSSWYMPAGLVEQPAEDGWGAKSLRTDDMGRPTIFFCPNFNAKANADLLRKAMGTGSDKMTILQPLINCNNAQRQEVGIVGVFKQMHGKDLITELKRVSGEYQELIMALMERPAIYDAEQLNRALKGRGTKERLIELTTRSNAQFHHIKLAYRQAYDTELKMDVEKTTSGYFRRLLISLCSGDRDEHTQNINLNKAQEDAQKLWRAGQACLGTEEIAFNEILGGQNFAQLHLVFDAYQRKHGHAIEKAIRDEFGGDVGDALLALVKSIRNRPAYFAELLYKSLKIRLIVTRSEIDLADIRSAYQEMYRKLLEVAIADDCSHAYKAS
uniref:Annexin n=1 Tax=Globodera pallida TaxID=36090 RepID=A0A183CA25_GLOPA